MEMTEFEINEELERTAALKGKNNTFLETMKTAISDYIRTGNADYLSRITTCREDEDFIESSETLRIGIMVVVFAKELSEYGVSVSAESVADYAELYDRYMYSVLMLRRIEMDDEDSFINEAYAFFEKTLPSPIFISEVLRAEAFENRKRIADKLFLFLKKSLSENDINCWTRVIKAEIE